jgi:hypothetical protein
MREMENMEVFLSSCVCGPIKTNKKEGIVICTVRWTEQLQSVIALALPKNP